VRARRGDAPTLDYRRPGNSDRRAARFSQPLDPRATSDFRCWPTGRCSHDRFCFTTAHAFSRRRVADDSDYLRPNCHHAGTRASRTGAARERGTLRLFVEHAPRGGDVRHGDALPCRKSAMDERLRSLGAIDRRCHYELFPELPERWKDVHRRFLPESILARKTTASNARMNRPVCALGSVALAHGKRRNWRPTDRRRRDHRSKLADEGLRESEERQHLALSAGKLATWDWICLWQNDVE